MEIYKLLMQMEIASSQINKKSDKALHERLGIGLSQFKILLVLDKYKPINQVQIARALGHTEAGISRQMKKLQAMGYIDRKVSGKSRREHLVILTAAGQRLLLEAKEILDRFHKPVFKQMKDKQIEILEKMIRNISN